MNRPVNFNDPTGHCGTNPLDPQFAVSCHRDLMDVISAYQSGDRDPIRLAARASGFTRWVSETGDRINQINAHMDTVFSNKPWQERLPASIDIGATSVITAATVVGVGQLAVAGARALAVTRLQSITNVANAELASSPALARNVLSRAEYAAGQNSANVARMQYGNAVERMVDQKIQSSWLDRYLFKHVGGPNNPDFIGRGIFRGLNFDVTTPRQVAAHLLRPGYGQGLKIATYIRPPTFRIFP